MVYILMPDTDCTLTSATDDALMSDTINWFSNTCQILMVRVCMPVTDGMCMPGSDGSLADVR